MTYYVRFECKEDVEWLRKVMLNQRQKAADNISAYCDIAENINRIADAVVSVVPVEDVSKLVERDLKTKAEEPKPEPKAKKSRAVNTNKGTQLCDTHKTYGAKRVPGSDCSTCWAAYKKFNPMTYTTARRKFERKLKQS